ncbi:flagellar basal-body rod protein FlgG [Salirhabdus euzebyi]|uniref:Flagellar basal-body rod protein FlgG n=1 Tax=Salirhabdus euzebyi TaxID=394506 RepID=A0A841Q6N5_9BACI|nr:flagellar hook-basal body protein [Salirhabdus euzebyi]MBB6453987.1 flagellar basal-body rod protein FlgG [Salirhabdus euzebyi]
MLRGFYTAAAGMVAQQRRQDVLSNNMANALTPGYKADQTTLRAFPELLIERMEANQIPVKNGLKVPTSELIGRLNTGVYMQETMPNFIQGPVKQTGMMTDLALSSGQVPDENGFLFFAVQNENGGTSYTRNGNFTVDAEGFLVSDQGYYVLDENGNQIQTNNDEFSVTQNGTIQTSNGATFSLGIVYHPNANELVKGANNLFEVQEGNEQPVNARNAAGVTFQVQQGFLEQSNVDTGQTMTEMMSTYRMFELNQRVLRAYDQNMEIAVNKIGQLG